MDKRIIELLLVVQLDIFKKNQIVKSQEKSQSLPVAHMYALVPGLVHTL
jgi:hypothetical protein